MRFCAGHDSRGADVKRTRARPGCGRRARKDDVLSGRDVVSEVAVRVAKVVRQFAGAEIRALWSRVALKLP